MLTKYILTIGGVAHQVPDECLMNWDDISFSLKRTDYSGVMRSFSTEFVFVGEAYDLLRDAYLTNGVLTEASIAVLTLNNDHTWTEQFSSPLDFSSIEMENGKFTVTAIDNALASLIKSKKGQKYEFPMSQFNQAHVTVQRMSFANSAKYTLPNTNNSEGIVDARIDETASTIISTEYIEPKDESSGYDGTAVNRFFAIVNRSPSPLLRIAVSGTLRCYLNPSYAMIDDEVSQMQFGIWDGTLEFPRFVSKATLFDNDITHKRINGLVHNMWIGELNKRNYATLDALKADIPATGLQPGMFGVVGNNAYPNETYWTENDVYEYKGYGLWVNMGAAAFYYQDRDVSGTTTISGLTTDQYPMLQVTHQMVIVGGTMTMTWSDPARMTYAIGAITPIQLLLSIVQSISPTATASIAADTAGLLARTYFLPAETLRRVSDAKAYSTFQQFADWMSAVFGYTYRIVGNEVQFVHRSAVFGNTVGKVIANVNDVKYSVNDGLIYTEVDAGYSKKEYGEIDGRLETNFTNYYETGYSLTEDKLSLISKYRSDAYGIEFTMRKGEKNGETTDDKNDEDFFVLCTDNVNGSLEYNASRNAAYAPAECVANNAAFIAAMGNGAPIVLKMTSSDGNNTLTDITIPEGSALFTIGELEFTTDDTTVADDPNSLVQLDYKGYRYTGYIKQAKARFGRVNGMEYTLIVKTITTI